MKSEIISNKISQIRKYLKILSKYKKYSKEEIKKDPTLKGAIERYLHLVTQATIDLSEALVKIKNLRKPQILRESFEILSEQDIIEKELAGKLMEMAGFRNVIVHDYAEVNYDNVYQILQKDLKDIEKFIKIVRNL